MNMSVQISETLFSVILDIYLGGELLDHMVILLLIFGGTIVPWETW